MVMTMTMIDDNDDDCDDNDDDCDDNDDDCGDNDDYFLFSLPMFKMWITVF